MGRNRVEMSQASRPGQVGKLRQRAVQTGGAIADAQADAEGRLPGITSRPQLCFSSRPRKAAKSGGQCQDQLQ